MTRRSSARETARNHGKGRIPSSRTGGIGGAARGQGGKANKGRGTGGRKGMQTRDARGAQERERGREGGHAGTVARGGGARRRRHRARGGLGRKAGKRRSARGQGTRTRTRTRKRRRLAEGHVPPRFPANPKATFPNVGLHPGEGHTTTDDARHFPDRGVSA